VDRRTAAAREPAIEPETTPAPGEKPGRAQTSRWKRRALRVLVGVVVLLIAAGLAFFLWLNSFIKRTIEQQTSQTLSLDTRVGGVSLDLLGHRLHLDHFRIASPAGFSPEPLLVVTGGEMGMTYDQLHGEPVHVASITFTRPRLLVEQRGGRLNFRAMVEQLPPPPARPMRLVIDEVTVQDATVVLRNIPGLAREVTVPVPTFVLHNVGSGEGSSPGGATVREVVMQLVTALVAHASNSDALPPEFRAILKGDVGAIVAQFGAEAQRQLLRAIPGDAGRAIAGMLLPKAPRRTPAGFLPGFLNGRGATTVPPASTHPTTAPATQPAEPAALFGKARGPFGSKKP
jgi:hypothetical protein